MYEAWDWRYSGAHDILINDLKAKKCFIFKIILINWELRACCPHGKNRAFHVMGLHYSVKKKDYATIKDQTTISKLFTEKILWLLLLWARLTSKKWKWQQLSHQASGLTCFNYSICFMKSGKWMRKIKGAQLEISSKGTLHAVANLFQNRLCSCWTQIPWSLTPVTIRMTGVSFKVSIQNFRHLAAIKCTLDLFGILLRISITTCLMLNLKIVSKYMQRNIAFSNYFQTKCS